LSPPSTSRNWKSAAVSLDDEIERLKASLVALEKRRNAVVPIAALPSEILLKIFALYLSSADKESPHLHAFSQVCQFWRCVALNAPSLWNCIDCTRSGDMITAMLTRSADASVVLQADFGRGRPHKLELDGLVAAMWGRLRMREVKLVLPCTAFDNALMACLSAPAPMLETCHINVTGTYGANFSIGHLFSDVTPRLRHLYLGGCSMDWGSPLFTSLRLLHLCTIPRDAQPTWNELFSMLARNPCLESLSLENVLNNIPADATLDCEPLELPRLRSLVLRDAWGRCATVLQYLCLPGYTRITVRPFHNWHFESDSGFCAALAQHWTTSAVEGVFLRALRLQDHGNMFEMQGWATERPGDEPPLLSMSVSKPCTPGDFDASAFLSAFGNPLSSVKLLEVECEADFSMTNGTDWVRASSSMCEVETLVVHQSALPAFASALSVCGSFIDSVRDGLDRRSGELVLFPRLRAVYALGSQTPQNVLGESVDLIRALRCRRSRDVSVTRMSLGPESIYRRFQSDGQVIGMCYH
jgi:hypothetical protein